MAIAALGIMKNSTAGVNSLPAAHNSVQSRSTSTLSTSSGWSRSGTHPSTGASSPIGPASLPPLSDFGDIETEDQKFISRVSQLPLVSGGLEWYERSKASSRVVKVSRSFLVLENDDTDTRSTSTVRRWTGRIIPLEHLSTTSQQPPTRSTG